MQESRLIPGVAFKKTFSYAGFEMQPKTYTGLKIALLNIELELKSERENAEVRVDSVEVRYLVGPPDLHELLFIIKKIKKTCFDYNL